ncbi:MAG TPA: tetraacyldisaccharide 4'-kinase [Porphyromonadaceae bacterium]|jgi:tetraacyldisaccharide 4'-kinase|uniref:tetraacyldisaccharide 4'-kinase n=1 Tax=Limibacterium fermenti TaxID=3229863 RepID=UPI000E9BBCD1|nr:tetraacyldisaccharide 4'-kinase [Porphyromonadaceae bacterium]HBL32507.1 tetraacyldisaccharide 4'-kinase [Porphyromonadaceae bacterium]HBX45996.1 tetraacyldisaccharide 4'-kinase [Porphyromonadaceae bacterium]HCM21865.1 tetraacyldisaccharide 4'-kinase [Porphyromonadaceae bacterium]
MDTPPVEIRRSLLPFSWLYGAGVRFRNFLFDHHILKQEKFPVPIICVGNITVGGTGKTPHIEYLIELLSSRYKVAVLSRGYKRKTKGFLMVEEDSKAAEVGDEPLQIKRKYPRTLVVVDKNRRRAIKKLLDSGQGERPDVILLDDGFQHRYVQPSLSILLVDSHRPVYEDQLLPAGSLRESISGKNRASMVIVTKCPPDMQAIDFRIYTKGLNLYPYQNLYFSSIQYGDPVSVFPEFEERGQKADILPGTHVLLVAGIAAPEPLVNELKQKTDSLHTRFFPDHHSFTKDDIRTIRDLFKKMEGDDKMIVTTEKDAMRFQSLPFLEEDLKKRLYYVPIKVRFIEQSKKEQFNKKINQHVRNYQTNR